jgi:hypothetical protein
MINPSKQLTYSGADVLELLASRDAAISALVSLEAESVFDESGCESDSLLEAKNKAQMVLSEARESKLGLNAAAALAPKVKAPAPAPKKFVAKKDPSVAYEWDVETRADGDTDKQEDGEVIDHDFCESFAEAKKKAAETPPEGCRFEIVLVCDDDVGRSWAELENGLLPERFCDALGRERKQVPKRFVDEVAKG